METNKYYTDFVTNMEKFGIEPEGYDDANMIQMTEELMFTFNMFLLV